MFFAGIAMVWSFVKKLYKTFYRVVRTSILYVISYFFPSFCYYCKQITEKELLCDACSYLIQPIATQYLSVTSSYKVKVYAASLYQNPVKFLVLRKHYKDRSAARALGHIVWHYTTIQYANFDIIIPVPLHWSRYAHRWFNQAYEIACVLASYSNKPVVNAVVRTVKTDFQAQKSKEERMQNVHNVFSLKKTMRDKIFGKHIVLVDDVMTTGATLVEVITVIKKARPLSITVAVAARVGT